MTTDERKTLQRLAGELADLTDRLGLVERESREEAEALLAVCETSEELARQTAEVLDRLGLAP